MSGISTSFYENLTGRTIEIIQSAIEPPASIIDFGAGTGRLAVPLVNLGFDVTAIEPCGAMLAELTKKAAHPIVTVESTMQDYIPNSQHDLALCVFTVILYLLDYSELTSSLQNVAASIKPGGLVLIDIPSKDLFYGYDINVPELHRKVQITPSSTDIYTYSENIEMSLDGEKYEFHDSFSIRYWKESTILLALEEVGLKLVKKIPSSYLGAGSSYYFLQKQK